MHDSISSTFSALADPTRRAILARLALGETSVSELAEPFAISMPAVSKHLRVLEQAGLISRGREAQWRPCKLNPEPLHQAASWLEEYRQFWDQSFDRLDSYLQTLQAEQPTEKPHKKKKKKEKHHGKHKK
jgi:DNA-binding transcriptional ArsR family regulator